MKFPKFCSLLSTQAMFFCRADCFDDPWEGVWPKKYYDAKYWKKKLTSARPNLSSAEIKKRIDGIIDYFKHSYQNRSRLAVTCWHENPHEAESFWKLYSNPKYGVAIKSTVGNLKKSIAKADKEVYIGKIDYLDLENDTFYKQDRYAAIQVKRKDFAHEKEVRAVIDRTTLNEDQSQFEQINGTYLECNLNLLIDAIAVSPLAEEWFFNVVKDLTNKFGIKSKCYKSSLYEKPYYI
ncbi:MAG: DUF2971 domain-containing protein [bacterium]